MSGPTLDLKEIRRRLDQLAQPVAQGSRAVWELAHNRDHAIDTARALLVAVARLTADLEQARALAATCSCGTSPMTYEGPEPDCPVHGAIRAFNEAQADLAEERRQHAATRAERDKLRAVQTEGGVE